MSPPKIKEWDKKFKKDLKKDLKPFTENKGISVKDLKVKYTKKELYP